MRSLARHTLAFGRVFALVFLLASVGNANGLRIRGAEPPERCYTFGVSDPGADGDGQLPLSRAVISLHNGSLHIAVGRLVPLFQTLVEKNGTHQFIEVHPLFTSTSVSPALRYIGCWFNLSYRKSLSPSSVKKHILNATFLI